MDPLWAELLNSDWRDHRGSGAREDRLGNEAWLARFLARAGWRGPGLPGPGGRRRLRELRGLLQRMADGAMARRRPRPGELAALDAVLGRAPLRLRARHGSAGWTVESVALADDLDALLGRLAGEFASVLARGEPERLKVCANRDCGWVMWDESRNGSRRWCSAAECGNLLRVRRFRRRRARGGLSAKASRRGSSSRPRPRP